MEHLPRHETVRDPARIDEIVKDAYHKLGHLLDDLEEPALLADPLCSDCPIVGASQGFRTLTRYPLDQVLGQNCRMLLDGVPALAISKSGRKNIKDYCNMCKVVGLTDIAEIETVQPNARQDGSHFVNFFMLGLCKVQQRIMILGVQMLLAEGMFLRLSQAESRQAMESTRAVFKRIREHLQKNALPLDGNLHGPGSEDCAVANFQRQAIVAQPDFGFFAERLQDHCLLINNGFTAIRREPQELAINCLVFGDRPVRRDPSTGSIGFTVHVDVVTQAFQGLPVLGFTRRQPKDEPELYPAVARCLGSSVLVGGCGEAFARDQHNHFKMGFKQPPPDQVRTWSLQSELPAHKRGPPVKIKSGDLLECRYLVEGRIQLLINGDMVLDFDVERPLDQNAEYYAVVDVCFSAYSLTIMPSQSELPSEIDRDEDADKLDKFLESEHQRSVRESSINSDYTEQKRLAEATDVSQKAYHNVDEIKDGVPSASTDSLEPITVTYEQDDSCCNSAVWGVDDPLSSDGESMASTCEDETKREHRQYCNAVDARIKTMVDEVAVKQGIKFAIASCKFMVTIADPRAKDCPLIAVSEEFETMTGFQRREILGENCRFLNQGCPMNPQDLINLRISSETGAPFTAVIPNRKKSGEMFLNLLDLRGLSVASNPETGEDLWFLIGIQADVTDLAEDDMPEGHIAAVQQVADAIRAGIAWELGKMAVRGAEIASESELPPIKVPPSATSKSEARQVSFDLPPNREPAEATWCLFEEPVWRPGAPLGSRRPDDSPAKDLFGKASSSCVELPPPSPRETPPSKAAVTKFPATADAGSIGGLTTVVLALSAGICGVALVQVVRLVGRRRAVA